MGIYDIKAIRHLFIEDISFDIEEEYFDTKRRDSTEFFSIEDNEVLKVPPRINLCYYLGTENSNGMKDYLINEYNKYRCSKNKITGIALKGIYFKNDFSHYKDILSVLISNMVLRQGKDMYTRVSMSKEGPYQEKRNRYNPLLVKIDKLKNLLTYLAMNDYIDLYHNKYASKLETRYIVKDKLKNLFKEYNVSHNDVELNENTNFIELTVQKDYKNGKTIKLLEAFTDNEETNKRNDILENYNNMLCYWKERINFRKPMPHFIYAVCKYNGEIGRGGRVYAPWQWNEISSKDRLKFTIDKSKVVEVDIKCCSLRIACHLLDFNPIQEDLYDIGDSNYNRNDIKFVVQQMLNMNSAKERTLAQKLTDVSNSLDLKVLLSNEDTNYIKKLATDVYIYYNSEDMHNLSSQMFFKDKGMTDIIRIETAVVFDVIKYFTDKDVIVLTVHDSYIIEEELQEELINTIINSYYNHTKYKPILTK